MKISEIINITGRKKREDRDARKRRMKKVSLYSPTSQGL